MLNLSQHIRASLSICILTAHCCLFWTISQTQAQQTASSVQNNAARAQAYFANAADYQNSGAFELAVEEWEKLLGEFPEHPQASVAWHHLGICSLQRKEPRLDRAIEAFRQALKDSNLSTREESLINLAWALYSQSRLKPGAKNIANDSVRRDLEEARQRLVEFLKDFADGAYTDQAIFYLGDIENALGNRRRSIEYFKKFLESQELMQSKLRPDALYGLAVGHEEERQAPEAQRRFEEFLEQYGSHPLADEVRLRRAGLLIASQRFAEAREMLEFVRNSQSTELADLALLRLGGLASRSGETKQASEYFTELIETYPDSTHVIPARIALGNIELQAGNIQAAANLFRSATTTDSPVAIEATHGLALALMKQQEHAQAVDLLRDAIAAIQANSDLSTSGSNDRINILLLDHADALYALDPRSMEAHQLYERIASSDATSPLTPRATYMAALTALETGRPKVAQKWAESFLSRFPDNPLRSEISFVAAESLIQQGLHDGAAKALSKLIEADGENENLPLWQLRLGLAYYVGGKYDLAESSARSAVAQLTDSKEIAEARFIIGASCLFLERLPSAIDELKTSHQTSTQWSGADEGLLLLGEAYQRSQNYSAARSAYEDLLRNFPSSRFRSQVLYKLAQLAAIEKDWSSAIEGYRSVVANADASSFHDFSLYGIAWSLMQQKNYQAAYDELQTLLKKELKDSIGTEALLAEGICLRSLGRPQEAINSFNSFLQRQPRGQTLGNGLYELGLALTDASQFPEAQATFSRIRNEVPEYSAMDKVLYELGWNAYEQDLTVAAINWFELLAENYPTSPLVADALYMIAENHYDAERYREAITVYQRILDSGPLDELREKALYKLGWSHFQLEELDSAAQVFDRQIAGFPQGPLTIDGLFLRAECDFRLEKYEDAFSGFQRARQALEESMKSDSVSAAVRTLIYLHGAQCLREMQRWNECEQWLKIILERQPSSPHLPTALYELGYCKQNQGDLKAALVHYAEVADQYRNEVAARARFMMGELHFSQKDYAKAIPEFQRVMYGFGGDQAPDEIKKWQVKSAYEAARCSELLLQTLNGSARKKAVETAIQFYQYVLDRDPNREMTARAQSRLGEIQKLR
jgi:TolA-binding protein